MRAASGPVAAAAVDDGLAASARETVWGGLDSWRDHSWDARVLGAQSWPSDAAAEIAPGDAGGGASGEAAAGAAAGGAAGEAAAGGASGEAAAGGASGEVVAGGASGDAFEASGQVAWVPEAVEEGVAWATEAG